MGARARGTAAMIACLVVLTGCSSLDYQTDTYQFTVPKTEYADASRVLVRGGEVTDVWITPGAETQVLYGYTPLTPGDIADNSEYVSIAEGDGSVTVCSDPDTEAEQCSTFTDVEQVGTWQAGRRARWDGPADGQYLLYSRSVTWGEGPEAVVTLDNGVVTSAEPSAVWGHLLGRANDEWFTARGHWVRYWLDAADEPFAVCYDEERSYDEETCYFWEPTG